jgi:nucleoside-diphosphate-sugar epimerase
MNNKVITIFGAGFIGKSLIFELLQKGYIVNAVSRKSIFERKFAVHG